jgi:hypothetical protein
MKLERLEEEDVFKLNIIVHDIEILFHEIAISNPSAILDYFAFVKVVVVKMLSTKSKEHQEFGQSMLHTFIETIHCIRPLVKGYQVHGGGLEFVNGTYTLSAIKCTDSEGFCIPGVKVRYERTDEATGKRMLLFLDNSFEDGDVTWCLSEEQYEELPHLEYTDYYTAIGSSKAPPEDGWETADGSEPPAPTVQAMSDKIPIREEHKSIQEDLAQWLIEKKIPDIILGTNVCPSFNKSFTSKIVFALDAYAEGSNIISSKMANLLVSILPSLQQSGAPIASALRHDTSSSKAALEAAKARLASAERWEHTASRSLKHAQNALMNAKTEYESAKKEADEARKYLASIDSSLQTNMNASSTNVAFDEDTPTITYDDAKPSMFVNDESTSTSIEEVVIKQRKFPFY